VPGAEAAGVIEAIGEGVEGFAVGQRVGYAAGFAGAYSEARLLEARHAVALPDAISDEDAAASLLKGMTAEYLINRCYPVNVGEFALVHAAAGGVGLYMCQWLKRLGVTVIGTTTSEDKKNLILANGGAVHLSKEFITDDEQHSVYGYVALPTDEGWGPMLKNVYVSGLSQEHGMVSVDAVALQRIQVGDVVVVLPVHACLTANLMREYHTLTGQIIPLADLNNLADLSLPGGLDEA